MSIKSVNRVFEVFMRDMMKVQECGQDNIESELRRLIEVTVNSCATMYGFSAKEALKRLNSNGEIIELPVVVPVQQKELEKAEKLRLKEAEKLAKEAEKAEKLRLKKEEDRKKGEIQCAKFWKKQQKIEDDKVKEAKKLAKESEKANESSERSLMKDEDVSSKAAEKLALKEAEKLAKETEKALKVAEKLALKEAKKVEKPKKTKKEKKVAVVQSNDDESLASTVLMTESEDEEPFILFQNIPLINEINSIRDVKKFKNYKKLSAGVKLARQILDI